MKKTSSLFLSLLCVFVIVGCGGNTNYSSNQNTEWNVIKDATCTEEGLKEKYVDGELKQEIIPALGHNYGQWSVSLAETCTEDGKEERKCLNCSSIEERIIKAHHVLKEGYEMNIDSHYYECENCPEKIDLAHHEFDVIKENRYAFFVDDINIFDNFHMFKVGYVNTLTCKDCNIKIIDYKLIKNYYYNGVRQHQYYLEYLGVPTIEYNLMYGFTHFISESAIEIKYDSNYNISSVYVDSRKENYPTYFNYTYIYEDDKLVKVELENNFVSTFGITYDLKYKDNKISEVTYTLVSGNDISKRVYLFDDNEKIISQVNYSIINSQSLKTLETIYQNGCLREKKTWTYNSSTGQLSSEANYQYENVFDSNNNILQHNNHDNTVSTTCTYNSNNQMLSMACSGGTTYSFEYENDKLVKMIYGNIVFDYQYDDNKVTVCDDSGKSFLEIEYISDYKIAE